MSQQADLEKAAWYLDKAIEITSDFAERLLEMKVSLQKSREYLPVRASQTANGQSETQPPVPASEAEDETTDGMPF